MKAHNPYAHIETQARQDALNEAYRIVDAEGGSYSAEERETRYADGHHTALSSALKALAKAGARDPDPDVAALRRRIAELEAHHPRVYYATECGRFVGEVVDHLKVVRLHSAADARAMLATHKQHSDEALGRHDYAVRRRHENLAAEITAALQIIANRSHARAA